MGLYHYIRRIMGAMVYLVKAIQEDAIIVVVGHLLLALMEVEAVLCLRGQEETLPREKVAKVACWEPMDYFVTLLEGVEPMVLPAV